MKARGLAQKKAVVLKRVPAVKVAKAVTRTKAAPPAPGIFGTDYLPSPNQGYAIRPEGVVLHHSCGTWEGDKSWILNPKSRVSYHCLINTDGRRAEFVPYNRMAWHAGISSFRGRPYCNSFMLGLAFTGNTVTGERRPQKLLLEAELASAVEWLRARMIFSTIPRCCITTHRAIAPNRKDDVSDAVWRQVMEAL